MKTLPMNFTKFGDYFTLIQRGDRSCIYKRRVSEKTIIYEVFLIKVKPERQIFGKIIPAAERLPHNEAFGYWAWICNSIDKAKKRFEELEKNINKN